MLSTASFARTLPELPGKTSFHHVSGCKRSNDLHDTVPRSYGVYIVALLDPEACHHAASTVPDADVRNTDNLVHGVGGTTTWGADRRQLLHSDMH